MDGDTREEVESEVETDFQDSQRVPCNYRSPLVRQQVFSFLHCSSDSPQLLVPEMNYPPSDLGNDPSYHDDALRLIRVNVRPRVWMTYVSDAKFYDVTRKGSRLTSAQSYNTGLYGVRYSPLHIINSW